LGAPFRKAHTDIGAELKKIQGDVAKAANNIADDLGRIHGHSVAVNIGLDLPKGVSAHDITGIHGHLAGGASGAAQGWAVVGEQGPELVHMRGGETVVPNHRLRGYAGGTGDILSFTDSVPSARQIGNIMGFQGVVSALAQLVKNTAHITGHLVGGFGNQQFPGGGGGGSGAAIARSMFPWPASMWPAFNYVEMREAGYNLRAQNPGSGAYGVAQFINGPSEYYQYGGNPNTFQGQFTGMFNYIRQRYGNPVNAANFERANNYYANGTVNARAGLAVVGEHGPELMGSGPMRIVLEIVSDGSDVGDALRHILRKHIRVRYGGNVTAALGN
jgi:SLT domain-containing protein